MISQEGKIPIKKLNEDKKIPIISKLMVNATINCEVDITDELQLNLLYKGGSIIDKSTWHDSTKAEELELSYL